MRPSIYEIYRHKHDRGRSREGELPVYCIKHEDIIIIPRRPLPNHASRLRDRVIKNTEGTVHMTSLTTGYKDISVST